MRLDLREMPCLADCRRQDLSISKLLLTDAIIIYVYCMSKDLVLENLYILHVFQNKRKKKYPYYYKNTKQTRVPGS